MQNRDDNQQGAPKRKRRRYSEADKAAALVALAANAELDAPLTATANQLQIADSTLFDWATGRGISDKVRELAEKEKKTLADIYRETAILGALRLRESLADDARCARTPLKDLATAAGVATDKAQLLAGAPTAITAHRDEAALAKMRAEAEEALQDALLATGGDRVAALAMLRECAPTLSEYVN